MSTRANIIVKDEYSELVFYRHSDGYPEGTLPTLEKFVEWVKDGKIRGNTGQAAGWLILIGADEYREGYGHNPDRNLCEPDATNPIGGWKCGAYEPTDGLHGDIEFLYVIDLKEKAINIDGQNGYQYEGKFGTFAKAKAW